MFGQDHGSTTETWMRAIVAGINKVSVCPPRGVRAVAPVVVQFLRHGDNVSGIFGDASIRDDALGNYVLPGPCVIKGITGDLGCQIACKSR